MADVVTLGQADVLRWRLRRLLIDPVSDQEPVEVARRLCGIQAQVPSAAELAVAARALSPNAAVADLRCALVDGRLLRTWAVRGTLHLLPPDVAARQLSLLADARTWQKGSWQRAFAPISVMAVLAQEVAAALKSGPLTREELVAAVEPRLDDPTVSDHLRSGWSALLKPLAWQGVLCQGPSRGSKVTFARPEHLVAGWRGLADPEEAGHAVVRDYLAAYGPASPEAFDAWLLRGATPKKKLRQWFAALADETVDVEFEGQRAVMLSAEIDELRSPRALASRVHLLPAFDQYLLGPGTNHRPVVAAEHRHLVSRAGGWISPVVLLDGRVVGTWESPDGSPLVTVFAGIDVPRDALDGAVERMAAVLDELKTASPST